jgi:hypothetical protein
VIQRRHITRCAGQQVSGTSPLDRRQRHGQYPLDELLPQLSQYLFTKQRRGVLGEPDQDPLHHEGQQDQRGQGIDPANRGAVFDALHQITQQPRSGQASYRRQRMQPERRAQRARMLDHQ